MSGKCTSILIADDHDIVRFGLVQLLHERLPDMEIREATTFEEVLAQLENSAISVAIVDLHMPGLDTTRGLVAVHLKRPDVRLLVLTASDAQADMIEALRAGAQGYITKREAGPQLLRALQQVMDGSVYVTPNLCITSPASGIETEIHKVKLTPKQREVLLLLAQGCSNKIIARRLSMSVSTAKFHVASLLRTLDAANRAEAAGKAIKLISAHLVD